MKNTFFLIIAMMLMAGEIFAGSVGTNRTVKALGFIKGSSTLNLSGQLDDAAMQSISDGNEIAIYNSIDSYLVFPTLFPRTKAGFGAKTGTQNVSVNTKNGKFKWTEKDVTPYFAFATGREKIKPSKAVFKSKGTLQTSELAELESMRLTVFDMLCAEQGFGYLASLSLTPQMKGKNYKFSYDEGKFQVKGSIDPKGKVTAKYAIPFDVAYPALLESEDIFTNKYDYSLVIIGEGDVKSGYYGPDKVEFKVTKNNTKFRYFAYNGIKDTSDFMKLELEADTEVTAVFGTYDFSLNVIGDGTVSAEFTGPDEVELKVTDGSELFFYYDVNGEKITDSNMTLSLQEDTVVEAYFKEDYIVVDLSGGPNAKSYPVTHIYAVPEGGWAEEYKTTKLVLRKIKPGTFTMGSPQDELGRGVFSHETQHQVTLTNAYYIGVFEVTQKQYQLITGRIPVFYNKGNARPVSGVSYDMLRGTDKGAGWPTSYDVDETSFFGKLRNKTDMIFDLPTEAQWEYACRAGTTTALNNGKNISSIYSYCPNLAEVGRYKYNQNDNKGGYTNAYTTVGSYLPNAWGLYDMHGNADELCLDWHQSDLGGNQATEPHGTSWGSYRVIRGGSYYHYAQECRSATRDINHPYDYGGFRVVLVQNVFSGQGNQIQKDFEFEIESGTENTLPIFQTRFYGKLKNGTEKLLEDMGKLEYDGASGIVAGIGKHKLTWIPDAAYTNIMNEVELRVEYEDVTEQAEYLVLDTTNNKMRVSPDAPDTTDDKCRTDELWLRRIEPGTFTMGSPQDELGRDEFSYETQHQVTLTKAYYVGVFEMTQKQCYNIMGVNPSSHIGDLRPVESVSYDMLRGTKAGSAWPENHGVDEGSFMGQLRKKAGNIFDLPTEAQWEYACRAGMTTALNNGTNLTNEWSDGNMNKLGRYTCNKNDNKGGYRDASTKVGSYLPNAWGLYDMHGNVVEWCLDWYQSDLGSSSGTDPKGASSGSQRVLRGGCWDNGAYFCRSASRDSHSWPDWTYYGDWCCHYLGFRVVLVQ